ncbi:Uncharacterised protein [Mycobacteroides abscessus subsp. abscessus]|nr:Uncharacterised protein [Mycobacteroides abscessus subsp. abscessus]
MLVYDEQLPYLDDSFEGTEVAIKAVQGARVDRRFRRNYAWAKYAADRGKLTAITVVVAIDSSDVAHTVQAVRSALSGEVLHPLAGFEFDCPQQYAAKGEQIYDAISVLLPPAPVVEAADEKPARKERNKPADAETLTVENGGASEDSGA